MKAAYLSVNIDVLLRLLGTKLRGRVCEVTEDRGYVKFVVEGDELPDECEVASDVVDAATHISQVPLKTVDIKLTHKEVIVLSEIGLVEPVKVT